MDEIIECVKAIQTAARTESDLNVVRDDLVSALDETIKNLKILKAQNESPAENADTIAQMF